MLPESAAYLTLEEVLAVRLYSGPAFQPINEFLRQICNLTGAYRVQLAKHAGLTFTATVSHLCRAIRKLAATTVPYQTRKPLYRAVRGELPRTFWVKDDQGLVTAVETAFMSTSAEARTAVDYMQDGHTNVLWELHPRTETDSGFHRGADISPISQFCQEKETLFPPCTMLQVKCPEGYAEFQAVNGVGATEHHAPRQRLDSLNASSNSPPGYNDDAVKESTADADVARNDASNSRCSSPSSRPVVLKESSVFLFDDSGRSHAVRSRWHKTLYKAVHEPNAREALARVEREAQCRFSHVQVLPTFV